MSYTIQHAAMSDTAPFWYHLECAKDLLYATSRARNYALDHGGFVCVQDETGKTVFGTDPVDLDRRISAGTLPWFKRETARRCGCCT
jgi:hypothetical protein